MAAAAALTSLPLFGSPHRFSSAITKKPFLFSFLAPQNPSFRSSCRSNPTRRIHMKAQNGIDTVGDNAFVLEDVPHLTALLPQLTAYPSPIRSSPAYGIVKQSFVTSEDVVAQRVVTYTDCCAKKNSTRGGALLTCWTSREGKALSPRRMWLPKGLLRIQIVVQKNSTRGGALSTCWTSREGINTVIREIVRGLNFLYGVNNIIGIEPPLCQKTSEMNSSIKLKMVQKRLLANSTNGILSRMEA